MGAKVEQQKLRAIPAVEKVLQALGPMDLPRPVVLDVVRRELSSLRKTKVIPDFEAILQDVRGKLLELRLTRIQPAINGSGIVVHTNLGRSPLGPVVVEILQAVAENYTNLEFDLRSGERGGRAAYLDHNLALLCGAEAATVANNCAAALVLILRHFTSGERQEVIISRGELLQIGGGFRIPEILEASGARLREVGATNKTSLADYSRVIGKNTALILKVHRSNFFMSGFIESPSTEELAALAKKKKIPFVEDLGSGAMIETESLAGLEHEPTPGEVLKRGVDLVCFSGDKLLGGPQAGIIAGKAKLVNALKKEPFFRALRCDKLILSALQTTVDLYLSGQAMEAIPALAMLNISRDELERRGNQILAALADQAVKGKLVEGKAQVGGGTLPRSVVPSVVLSLTPRGMSLEEFSVRLRTGSPPVIGFIAQKRFNLDLRTIFPRQDADLVSAISHATREG
jgi:L-seryl-tRNA(Ser) seleniumtransferase